MKLSRKPSRIVGLRVGEIAVNLLSPGNSTLVAKFVLLRDPELGDNMNAGLFTKTNWRPETTEAFKTFIHALEDDAVQDLFGDGPVEDVPEEETRDSVLKFPSVPVLGKSK